MLYIKKTSLDKKNYKKITIKTNYQQQVENVTNVKKREHPLETASKRKKWTFTWWHSSGMSCNRAASSCEGLKDQRSSPFQRAGRVHALSEEL